MSVNGIYKCLTLVSMIVGPWTAVAEDYDPSVAYSPLYGAYLRPDLYTYGYDPYDGRIDRREGVVGRYSPWDRNNQPIPRLGESPVDRTLITRMNRQDDIPIYGYVPPSQSPQNEADVFDRDFESTSRNGPASIERSTRPQIQQFDGEIVEIVQMTGGTDNRVHLFARVREPSGALRLVGLGPWGEIELLREGDFVKGVGTRGVVRGRPVLLAQQFSVNGRWHAVDRHLGDKPSSYSGEIMGIETTRLAGVAGEHVIADIRLQDDRRVTVLLGRANELRNVALRFGERVIFWARPGTLNGLSAMIAEQLEIAGRTYRIDYAPDRAGFDTR